MDRNIVYIGTIAGECYVAHNDANGMPVEKRISINRTRKYLQQDLESLKPVLILPYEDPTHWYDPLTTRRFESYFSGINGISYSGVHPDVKARLRKRRRREREKLNKKDRRKQRK